MINLKSIPFFKILLPYLLGIAIVLNSGFVKSLHFIFIVAIVLVVVSFLFQKFTKPHRYKQWLYIFFLNTFLIALAQESCWLYQSKNKQEHYSHFMEANSQSFIGTINELPVIKEKSVKIPLHISVINKQEKWHYTNGEIIIYAKKDSLTHYNIGDKLFINSSFNYLNEPKNINEFNYKQFLEHKNIYNVVYATSQQIQIIPSETHFSVYEFGLHIKQKVVDILRNSGLSQNAFSICSALLVGYDDEIENDVMQSFAHSGTLHVLSVSGMHTGLLYGLIVALFSLFDKHDNRKILKCMVVLSALTLFTIITGFAPSVLRASIMLAFIVVGNTFYKNGNSYNTLFLSAFVILLFNPLLITDVGFLLSYAAVFGILFFYPLFQQWHTFDNKIAQWAWSLSLMSVSATVATLPISLAVFHQFPLWFVFSNLMIIPLCTMLMALAALLLLCYKIAFLKTMMAFLINTITSVMLWLASLTNNQSYGYIDHISFSKTDSIFLIITIISFIILFSYKQFKHLVIAAITIITWLCVSIIQNYHQSTEQEFIVFHVKKKTAILVRNGKTVYINASGLTSNEYERFIKPYILTISNPNMIITNFNYVKVLDKSIINARYLKTVAENINADFIIVSDDTKIDFTKLNHKPLIIADCSNSYSFTKRMKQQCVKQGLAFYDVKEKGAFKKMINVE